MVLFKCSHHWIIDEVSNVLKQDGAGYPLRLCICKCTKCKKYDQKWIDVPEKELEELKTGESVLLEWR